MIIMILLGIALFVTAAYAIYEHDKNKKLYCNIDRLFNELLDRTPISVSDLKEGSSSALAGKAIRIQEKMEHDVSLAQGEKEQVKSLISNMSHQLKTPLANLMMYQELLEDLGNLSKQQQHFLHKIRLQSEKIDWILQSLFKMTRLEQGAIEFETGAISLKTTLLAAVNEVYDKAEQKNIEIITEPFDDCLLLHNSKWTAEVFANIFENAVKYTEDGGRITVSVRPLELFTEIQIRDNGIGIDQKEQNYVFQRFYRSKAVEHREGSGIGLYLSRLILEKEGGYITVTSKIGEGSCFSVFLQNCHN